MDKLRIAIPGLLAALALQGCSDGTTETRKTIAADLCAQAGTTCDATAGLACDPVDGLCKCGGHGGPVCPSNTVCHLDDDTTPPTPTCVSTACDAVTCDLHEACDAADGLCKCHGESCGPGRTCLADGCADADPCAGVTCGPHETCDPANRICTCGGSTCSVGQTCAPDEAGVGHCVGRLCVGKNCGEGSVCNPADGLCHCGGAGGDACTVGQTCAPDSGTCIEHDACDDVVCTGNTTCSPMDGKCRCGGFDATAPICAPDQTCDLAQSPPRCVGGDACADIVCAPNTNLSCDGETGTCKCGGTGGVACAPAEGCVDSGGEPTCVTLCDPNAPNVSTAVCGQTPGNLRGCYLSPADGIAYCTRPGTAADGDDCRSPTDCAADHHCVVTPSGGTCRRYCDTTVPNDCYLADRSCVPLANRPAGLPNLGVCMVVTP